MDKRIVGKTISFLVGFNSVTCGAITGHKEAIITVVRVFDPLILTINRIWQLAHWLKLSNSH